MLLYAKHLEQYLAHGKLNYRGMGYYQNVSFVGIRFLSLVHCYFLQFPRIPLLGIYSIFFLMSALSSRIILTAYLRPLIGYHQISNEFHTYHGQTITLDYPPTHYCLDIPCYSKSHYNSLSCSGQTLVIILDFSFFYTSYLSGSYVSCKFKTYSKSN